MYSYELFRKKLLELSAGLNISNPSVKKVFDAVKDTLDVTDSLSKLNQNEINLYFEMLSLAMVASNAKNK